MTKAEIMNKIKEIIGDEDSWLILYYKDKIIGAIQLGKTNSESKTSILDKFEIVPNNKKGTFSLWFNHDYGYCYFAFDECKIKTL